jgi:hypothetical protein
VHSVNLARQNLANRSHRPPHLRITALARWSCASHGSDVVAITDQLFTKDTCKDQRLVNCSLEALREESEERKAAEAGSMVMHHAS